MNWLEIKIDTWTRELEKVTLLCHSICAEAYRLCDFFFFHFTTNNNTTDKWFPLKPTSYETSSFYSIAGLNMTKPLGRDTAVSMTSESSVWHISGRPDTYVPPRCCACSDASAFLLTVATSSAGPATGCPPDARLAAVIVVDCVGGASLYCSPARALPKKVTAPK